MNCPNSKTLDSKNKKTRIKTSTPDTKLTNLLFHKIYFTIQNLKLAFAMHYIILFFSAIDYRYSTLNLIPISFLESFVFSTSKCDIFNMALLSNSPKSLWTSSTWVIFKLELIKGQSTYMVSKPLFNFTAMKCNFHTLCFIPPHISPPQDSIISLEPPL